MIRLIAIDDEPLALKLVQNFVERIPGLLFIKAFSNPFEALQFLETETVDILISDINMPDMTGLELLRRLELPRLKCIFLTAYAEHALDGFNLNVIDYLVKPIMFDRFKQAIDKAVNLIDLEKQAEGFKHQNEDEEMPEYIFVYSEYRKLKITISEILFIASMGDYVKFYIKDQKSPILSLARLKAYADSLAPYGFMRVHRSYVVNKHHVISFSKKQLLLEKFTIPIGANYGFQT